MKRTVVVLGVGALDGVGGAIAQRFAEENFHVLLAGRTAAKIEATSEAISSQGGSVEPVVVDVTLEADQDRLFDRVATIGNPIESVIYNAGNNQPIPFEKLSEATFEEYWRVGCLGAFITAKRAIPLLAANGSGSFLVTGASASLRGRPKFGHFASAKGALRNLVQSLARQYWSEGVHVAHVIIDGAVNGDTVRTRFPGALEHIGEDATLTPTAIAEAFWAIHTQNPHAWTHEIDVRPSKESNW
jgi:NAD(P)-dependent dehydrogenase (short-subunit alcohol dehydrogenase family)